MQGYNKYYPPDYDGKSSLNALNGRHSLGKRASKIKQGIIVVRFEIPISVWCNNCNTHISEGVRFNAEKQKIGTFYTSPIWGFKFKCHQCAHIITIKTDPENTTYVVTGGARKKITEYDGAKIGAIEIKSNQDNNFKNNKYKNNPFSTFETTKKQLANHKSSLKRINDLMEYTNKRWADPYTQSQKLRRHFRTEKKLIQLKEKERKDFALRKGGLNIDILDNTPTDTIKAMNVNFGHTPALTPARNQKLRHALAKGLYNQVKDETDIRKAKSKTKAYAKIINLNIREKEDPFLIEIQNNLKHPKIVKKNTSQSINKANKKILGVKLLQKINSNNGNQDTSVSLVNYDSD